jgi:hypothetical protein
MKNFQKQISALRTKVVNEIEKLIKTDEVIVLPENTTYPVIYVDGEVLEVKEVTRKKLYAENETGIESELSFFDISIDDLVSIYESVYNEKNK